MSVCKYLLRVDVSKTIVSTNENNDAEALGDIACIDLPMHVATELLVAKM